MRVITEHKELDALRIGAAVIEASGDLCQLFATGWFGIIQEPHGDPWLMCGAEDIEPPATVLWEPGA